MLCDVDPGIAFHRLECLNSICENKCKLKSENILVLDGTKYRTFYLFERVQTYFFNSTGEKVQYARTARVDKMETLISLYERLQIMAKSYILPRFHVAIDYSF